MVSFIVANIIPLYSYQCLIMFSHGFYNQAKNARHALQRQSPKAQCQLELMERITYLYRVKAAGMQQVGA